MQVTDPVCGMQLESDKAAAKEIRQGQVYYFCSAFCHDRFLMKNLAVVERVLRVALGGTVAIGALVLLLIGHDLLVWRLLYVALIALGADFVVTGVRGYCPLYKRLGWSTAPSKI